MREVISLGMLKRLMAVQSFLQGIVRHAHSTTEAQAWNADPLSHPALLRMSLKDLADLPFDPARIADGERPCPPIGGGDIQSFASLLDR